MKQLLLTMCCATFALASCKAKAPAPADAAAPPKPPVVMMGEAAAPLSEHSIYDLPFVALDANGNKIALDALRGKPVLISMFYASCKAACPMLIAYTKRIMEAVDEPLRSDLRVLMISFDAARDNPAALTRLAAEQGLNAQWLLAAAEEDQARELAAILGIKYRVIENNEFYHTSVITALDREGRPLARLEGLSGEIDAFVATVQRTAMAAEAAATVKPAAAQP